MVEKVAEVASSKKGEGEVQAGKSEGSREGRASRRNMEPETATRGGGGGGTPCPPPTALEIGPGGCSTGGSRFTAIASAAEDMFI